MAKPDGPSSRPSPEALLEAARREQRGKLKIFLGAAPGVGKTYEMLSSARKKRGAGVDVVVGVVETHGRLETQALLDGLEVLPRRREDYRGTVLQEMDLDAILKRRPQLVLVDELAHTNAPGSRHPKRYQDVEELLAAGIDVYSTLNIQHVESLNDIVAGITQVRVRETVPDAVVDAADEVEVIDITPTELIERLQEGRVYQGEGGERALRHYFTPGNLTALRELVLRRAAARVDAQMREHRRAQGIQEVWAASERVMVCVNESPAARDLVRSAKRLADRLSASWSALYFESPRSRQLSEEQRDRIAETLRLAERLGADTATLPGQSIVDGVLAYAQEHNVTHIVVGKSQRSRWFELLHGSVVDELVRRAVNRSVHVIAEPATEPSPARLQMERLRRSDLAALVPATGLVAAATAIGWLIHSFIRLPNISLIYIAAVLIVALRYGLAPSLFTSVLSTLAYNYFFTEPRYSFVVHHPANAMALVFFVAIAFAVSQLMTRLRAQAETVTEQARTTSELLNLSRKLAGARKLDELADFAVTHLAQLLRVQATLLTPDETGLKPRGTLSVTALNEADLAAAAWSFEKHQAAGRGADTLPGARRLFLPLTAASGVVGVIGVHREEEAFQLAPNERRLLDAVADLVAISIERIRLAKQIDQNRLLAETEQLRSALLTSISHDLRTPLASIMGAITSLRSYGDQYDAATRDDLLGTAQDETDRMNRFIGNLLDMTRLDAGALQPKLEPCDLQDIAASALQRAARALRAHRVATEYAAPLPLVKLDFVLMEQVLVNLLENAAKYASEGTTVTLAIQQFRYALTLEVRDEGPGIPAEELPRLFTPFHRIRHGDQQRAGIGLGLAVCRGFVEAMGGRIRAANRKDRSGSVFEIELPASLLLSAPRVA
jgi:two-component system sensor histidine kinase KdpD